MGDGHIVATNLLWRVDHGAFRDGGDWMDGWLVGWMVAQSGDQTEKIRGLALSLGDRFMGGEDVELVADGRRVLVRKGTAVGWLRVRNGAGWVCCGLCLVSGCVRPGSGWLGRGRRRRRLGCGGCAGCGPG